MTVAKPKRIRRFKPTIVISLTLQPSRKTVRPFAIKPVPVLDSLNTTSASESLMNDFVKQTFKRAAHRKSAEEESGSVYFTDGQDALVSVDVTHHFADGTSEVLTPVQNEPEQAAPIEDAVTTPIKEEEKDMSNTEKYTPTTALTPRQACIGYGLNVVLHAAALAGGVIAASALNEDLTKRKAGMIGVVSFGVMALTALFPAAKRKASIEYNMENGLPVVGIGFGCIANALIGFGAAQAAYKIKGRNKVTDVVVSE